MDPRDVSTIWRSKSLTFDALIEHALVQMFGVTAEGLQKLKTDPDGEGSLIGQHTFFKDALAPGDNLNLLTLKFLEYLENEMKRIEDQISNSADRQITIELQSWTRKLLVMASTNALLGPTLLRKDPDVPSMLWEWEEDFNTFSLGLPHWMMKRAVANREKMIQAFGRHIFDKDALCFVTVQEELMKRRGLSDRDIGAGNFCLWSAVQANAPLTAFWLLHFICVLPGYMEKIRREVAPAFDPSSGNLTDISHLVNNTPLLNAMYHETLRYTSGALSVRKVEEDTIVAGYAFLAGSLVMMPVRPGHFDPGVFGNDVDEFVPDRFLREDDKQSGRRNPGTKALRPFGGGNTLCPGRHFATNEIFAFVATVVHRFDLEPVAGQAMAKPDMKVSQVGTHVGDREVKLCLRIRS